MILRLVLILALALASTSLDAAPEIVAIRYLQAEAEYRPDKTPVIINIRKEG